MDTFYAFYVESDRGLHVHAGISRDDAAARCEDQHGEEPWAVWPVNEAHEAVV